MKRKLTKWKRTTERLKKLRDEIRMSDWENYIEKLRNWIPRILKTKQRELDWIKLEWETEQSTLRDWETEYW